MAAEPFWESSFEDLDAPSPFGPPSEEFIELVSALPKGASVLDLGCGDGRNALFLARHGCKVDAIDISHAAITKVTTLADRDNLAVEAQVCDLQDYRFNRSYDLVIAHGCLHLLKRPDWARLLAEAKTHTRTGGYHVVVVFTDAIPPPDDLRPWTVGLFQEGEIFNLYSDWIVLTRLSYVLNDEHPGGIRHRHRSTSLLRNVPDETIRKLVEGFFESLRQCLTLACAMGPRFTKAVSTTWMF